MTPLNRAWWRIPWPWRQAAAIWAEEQAKLRPPAPGPHNALPAVQPAPPGLSPAPGPPTCPGCAAALTYAVHTWDCGRVHLRFGTGELGGVTPCHPPQPDLIDLEYRDLITREGWGPQ